MGVVHINYNIATCDICGKTLVFESVYSRPLDWNSIEDEYGLIKYKCVCLECSQKIKDYIEGSLRRKENT